ncbi:2-oxo acid dehydrogenase subunit E2 [Bacillus timonensis]|nr:2-oxo acid dehydrogenase subunit E2 [Bacillus timonensis]
MVEVKLHDIGEGMTEADIVHFLVSVGDVVKPDQPLVEVQTDKMVAEIPSPSSGIVKEIKVGQGDRVLIGSTILLIETEEGNRVNTIKHDTKTGTIKNQQVLAAPYTRKIARENDIDLSLVNGSGPAGRITDKDIYAFIESKKKKTNINTKEIMASKEFNDVNSNNTITESHKALKNNTIKESIPFSNRRKQIANKMTKSLFTIPHCTHFEEIDVTELLNVCKQLKESNRGISIVAFFIKALSISLKQFPIFNSKLDEENEIIILEKEHNIGIATDAEEGLIVPVIHNVENMSVLEINHAMKDLTIRAQKNELKLKDLSKGTFTISNVGPLGSVAATPIINHPEVALVAFHKTKKMPIVNSKDEIIIRSMMNVSMSFDHRIADGATAVAFTNKLKYLIEHPYSMAVELV